MSIARTITKLNALLLIRQPNTVPPHPDGLTSRAAHLRTGFRLRGAPPLDRIINPAAKIVAGLTLIILVTGCAGLSSRQVEALNAEKKIGTLILVGERMSVKYKGLTPFGNSDSEIDISPLHLTRSISKTLQSRVKPRLVPMKPASALETSPDRQSLSACMKEQGFSYLLMLKPLEESSESGPTGLTLRRRFGDLYSSSILLDAELSLIDSTGAILASSTTDGYMRKGIKIPLSYSESEEITPKDISSRRLEIRTYVMNSVMAAMIDAGL